MMLDRFENAGKLKILVIGDLILDRYIYGSTSRISPEAPVPVVLYDKEEIVLGGAANVAANISKLGATPILIGIVGNDKAADSMVELVEALCQDSTGIIRSNRTTTTKTRVVSKKHQILRLDDEDCRPISKSEEDLILISIKNILATTKVDGIVLQDYK